MEAAALRQLLRDAAAAAREQRQAQEPEADTSAGRRVCRRPLGNRQLSCAPLNAVTDTAAQLSPLRHQTDRHASACTCRTSLDGSKAGKAGPAAPQQQQSGLLPSHRPPLYLPPRRPNPRSALASSLCAPSAAGSAIRGSRHPELEVQRRRSAPLFRTITPPPLGQHPLRSSRRSSTARRRRRSRTSCQRPRRRCRRRQIVCSCGGAVGLRSTSQRRWGCRTAYNQSLQQRRAVPFHVASSTHHGATRPAL